MYIEYIMFEVKNLMFIVYDVDPSSGLFLSLKKIQIF